MEVKSRTYIDYLNGEQDEQREKIHLAKLAKNIADREIIELENNILIKTDEMEGFYKEKPFSLAKVANHEMTIKVLNEKLKIMKDKFEVLFPKTK